jgi:hypothetical protein
MIHLTFLIGDKTLRSRWLQETHPLDTVGTRISANVVFPWRNGARPNIQETCPKTLDVGGVGFVVPD